MLALIDTHPTCIVPWRLYARMMAPYFLSRFRFHLKNFRAMSGNQRSAYFRGRLAALRNLVVRNIQRAPLTSSMQAAVSSVASPDATDYYCLVGLRYKPLRYSGTVDLFMGEDARPSLASLWQHFASGGVGMHRVEGTHLTVIDADHVQSFAKIFKEALCQAQASAHATPTRA